MTSVLARLRPPPWALGVFVLALLMRVGFQWTFAQPLLYAHQYTYLNGALRLAQHPEPWVYVLGSDEWRTWNVHWTVAPLYFLLAGGLLRLAGEQLWLLFAVQCLLESLVAVQVARLGRALAGTRGTWAGIAYALHWSAVELPSCTLTENLHTFLLVSGLASLALDCAEPPQAEPRRPGLARLFGAGVLVGLAALTRSVGSAFLPLSALWLLRRHGLRRGWPRAVAYLLGGAVTILPWTARNVFVLGERVPIETTVYENLLYDSTDGPEEYRQALAAVVAEPTPAARRAAASARFWRTWRERPGLLAEKAWDNLWHLLRPEGLDGLLRVERSVEPWGHLKTLLGDDLLLVVCVPLFVAYLLAGKPTPVRAVVRTWCGYYLVMLVLVFHNEVRYRSALTPFALAAAAGTLAQLAQAQERRRTALRCGLAAGAALVLASLQPYLAPAARALVSWSELVRARRALQTGRLDEAMARARTAAAAAPRSAWPHTLWARTLIAAGRAPEALASLDSARELGSSAHWSPVVARPRVLSEAGRRAAASRAAHDADRLAWQQDPWFALEVAWAELPAPHTDQLLLGAGNDYGAVRGFFHPRGDPRLVRGPWNRYERLGGPVPPPGFHRWSARRAALRVRPATVAAAYDVTLWMGVPFPAPRDRACVRVSAGRRSTTFSLGRDIAPHSLRVSAGELEDDVLVVKLAASPWLRLGEPAEMGVRVDRLQVAPAER